MSVHPVTRRLSESYDEIPYGSRPVDETHPIRIASAAALRGLEPVPVERCRVLELGCAEGGNLLPLAGAFPGSSFVGVDLSARQVQLARASIAALGLTNVAIHQLDLVDLDDRFGDFDYVIAHGVYSWVPSEVQEQVLAICGARLNGRGLAYVSYNTYPGWQLKQVLRALVVGQVAALSDRSAAVEIARSTLAKVAADVDPAVPYGALVQQHIRLVLTSDDAYIAHEYLDPVNEPLSVTEFVHRAARHGLQYVDDLVVRSEVPAEDLAGQQFVDVLRGTAFRATVLCRAEHRLVDDIEPAQLLAYYVTAHVTSVGSVVIADGSLGEFDLAGTGSVSTASPILKAALVHLSSRWPTGTAIASMLATLSDVLAVPPGEQDDLAVTLCGHLLRLHRCGVVEISTQQYPAA